ncbi:MAG: hypothetical protein ACNA8W_18610, partial [Bradymonadaceae bacterium]
PDGNVMTELSPNAVLGDSLVRMSGTSAVFSTEEEPSPGRCFHVVDVSPTSGVNDEAVQMTITGYGFNLELDDVYLDGFELDCSETGVGLVCEIPITSTVGAVDLILVRVGKYVEDNGAPMRVDRSEIEFIMLTLEGAYTYEEPPQ